MQEFGNKLKVQWMKHQIDMNSTPLVIYDSDLQRVTVNDSALVSSTGPSAVLY